MRSMQKLVFLIVAVAASGTAMAGNHRIFTGQTIGPVAELTSNERAWFQARWREMSPAQREAIRVRLRQEWRGLSPEQRQLRGQELIERLRRHPVSLPSGEHWRQRDDGYGQG